jgi:hypothetical protein
MFPHRRLLITVTTACCVIASAHAQSCACGYSLSAYGNAYFQKALIADFTKSTLSGTATSSSWLSSYGLYIANGYQAGGVSSAADHTTPIAHYTNVRIQNKTLQLVVPGGQKITNGGQTSVAQVEGPSGIVGGVFTMNAKIDATQGTDQSIVSRAVQCGLLDLAGAHGTSVHVSRGHRHPRRAGYRDSRVVSVQSRCQWHSSRH